MGPILTACLLIAGASSTGSVRASETPSAPAGESEVSFRSADGVLVHGGLHMPPNDGPPNDGPRGDRPVAAVLLVHGGRQDRSEWAPLLPELHARGWATLAIDLRGHGQTGGEIADWGAFFNDPDGVPHDVEAAMGYLAEQAGVDPKRIAVVGSSVGANLACVAVEKWSARGAVFFSGKTEAARNLAGGELNKLHSTLYIAAAGEQGGARAGWANELAAMSTGASRARIVRGSSTHGAALLAEERELVPEVIGFLGGLLEGDRMETVEFPSGDGLVLTADHYAPHPAGAPLILALHQARWSRGEYRESAPRFTTLGFNVLALDQRSGGAVNEVVNETAERANAAELPADYLDAEPDILAALAWARKQGAKRIVLVGSSYSASLALKVAAEHPELVDAAVSFSPGEYFGREHPSLISSAAKAIACPVWISSSAEEGEVWEEIYGALPAEAGKRSYLPKEGGQHGSRSLWPRFDGYEAVWDSLEPFLLELLQ